MARENKEQQLDEETLRRRAAIRKAQRRRKATVAKFLNGVKAAFVLIAVMFLLSLIIFPGWTSSLRGEDSNVYASERGTNPKMEGDARGEAPKEDGKADEKLPEKEPEPEKPKHQTNVQLTGDESKVYQCLSAEPVHIDTIVRETHLPIFRVLGALTQLEMKGLTVSSQGRKYSLK